MLPLILASESTYKRELLTRLGIPFQCFSPKINEISLPSETPEATAQRLSIEKALAIIELQKPNSVVVIGADQTAEYQGELVRKPLTHHQAVEDLKKYSGQTLSFFTSACLICPDSNYQKTVTETIYAKFRTLSNDEIDHYLQIDQPYDCAGAFKCENLGISLFESIESSDPFALIGLPLIGISRCLRELGYNLYQPL